MEIVWFGVLAALLIGYFALEGFDLGVGMLLPVLGRTQEERDRLVARIAPFTLANEVWLVALAGVLFGAFPALEREVIFGLYPLVVALLGCWILRDAGLWFRRRLDGAAWRACWDHVICAASAGLALVWGTALVAAVQDSTVSPLGVACGVAVAAAFVWHGWNFTVWQDGGLPGWRPAVSAAVAALPAAVPLAAAAGWFLEHAAAPDSLARLGLLALPALPVMAAAQVWVWRTFGPRSRDRDRGRLASFF